MVRPMRTGPVTTSVARSGSEVIIGDPPALAHLLGDWQRLHHQHRERSPFQSAPWWQAYVACYGGADTVTVGARQDARLTGAAALQRRTRGPVRILVGAPPGISDYTDVLLAEGEQQARALVDALLSIPDWDVLDLGEVPPAADAWRLLPHWPGVVRRFPAATCVLNDGRSIEEFAATLPRTKRKQYNQQQRRGARAGISFRPATGNPADAVATLLGFHRQHWSGRGMTLEHGTSRFQDFLARAVRDLGPERAVVVEFLHHGQVRGAALYLCSARYVGIYLTGHHPMLREHVNLHVLESMAGFALVAERGLEQFNLLRGIEPSKMQFPGRLESNERVLLVRPGSVRGRAHATAVSGRRQAAALVARRRERSANRPGSRPS